MLPMDVGVRIEASEAVRLLLEGCNLHKKTRIVLQARHTIYVMYGQLKPGYNLQLGVSGEYIVGVDVSSK